MTSTVASSYMSPSVVPSTQDAALTDVTSLSDLSVGDEDVFDCPFQDLNLEDIKNFLVNIARKAGDMMLAATPTVDESETKRNTSDRVTATDKAVENMVKTRLRATYPRIDFLGEESHKEGQKLTDEPTFVVDPIDGTLNFIHAFPNSAVSLALTVQKKPVVGVVYNPFRRDLFSAVKGKGAFLTKLGGETVRLPLKNSQKNPIEGLNSCLCAVEWGSERTGPNWDLRMSVARKLLTAKSDGGAMCHSMRSLGSAALDFCYVACGQFDLFWEGGVWLWDVAAGWIIVEEAGGIVVSANPDDWNPTVEGRSYFCVRAAPSGQDEVVEELWSLMEGRRFVHAKS